MKTTANKVISKKARDIMAEAKREGIDLSLLRENLRLTPTERIEHNQRALRFVLDLREAGAALRKA